MTEAIPSPAALPLVLNEIQSGDGLALSAAGRLFPAHRGSGSVDPSTVFRWVTRGSKTAEGRLVKLEAVRVGGRWLTSKGALTRFVAALTSAVEPTPLPPSRSPTERTRASAAAGRKLKQMGA